MPIQFSCSCGRAFEVGEEHAGKRTKCPTCGAATTVPKPEPEELELDVEIVEDEVFEAEVVEDEPPPPRRKSARNDDDSDERPRRKKKRRAPDRGGSLARMYEEQARKDMRRDRAIARAADSEWGRDEDGGWTMFGVHVTAGVLSGAGMFLFGLLSIAFILIFKDDEDIEIGPRAFIGAIVFTALGLIVLVKSVFFGEED